MADINIEEIVIGFLDANKPSGWQVFGDMPKERPEAFILVDRTGGPREFVVQDRAEILIEVYHKDSRESASDQANVIADIIKNLEVLEPVMRAKVTSLVKLEDLLGQYWRYQIYCDVYYRRDVSTDGIIYPVIPSTGAVSSVNGKTGVVVIDASDVGADPAGSADAAEAAANAYTDAEIAGIDYPVDSVNGQTGAVSLDADDIDDTTTTHKFATAAQLAKADSAIQPEDLATVATTGAYADLTGKPTIPDELTDLDTTVTGAQLNAMKTKVDGIEAGADVTDAANVAAAGAVMESDTTTADMDFVVDEDDMTSNSATKIPTQQSVKAYADKKGALSYEVFTSNGTWTKPDGAKVVEVFAIGGGGGGGKGKSGAEGTKRNGGGGGGTGGAVIGQFDATGLTSTVAVTVGTGGAGATTDGAFAAGGNGGNSSFGSYVQAGGGNGGSCGSGFLGAGGGAAGASSLVAAGGASGNFSGVGFQPPGSNGHMGSGAGGAARNAANTTSPALAGGNSSAGAGGTGGGAASVGGNGANGSGTNGGAGGGGGGIGQVGGNGGTNGGGGGGGGAAIAPAASGNGGAGGAGIVIVITYG